MVPHALLAPKTVNRDPIAGGGGEMAPTMEQPGRRVAEWRVYLLDKGLKVNAGKSKLTIGSSGVKMVENCGNVSVGKECRQTLLSM